MENILTIISFEHFFIFCLCMLVGTVVVLVKTVLGINKPQQQKRKIIRCVLAGTLATVTAILIYTFLDNSSQIPTFLESSLGDKPWNSNISEITVHFKTPIRLNDMKLHTYPEHMLTIKSAGYFGNLLPYARSVTLSPLTTIPSGQQIMVYFADMNGIIPQKYGGEHLLEVKTVVPEIIKISPEPNASPIIPSQTFTIDLNTETGFESQWQIESTPPHEFLIEQNNSRQLFISPITPLKQATTYTLRLLQTPVILRKNDGEILFRGPPEEKRILTYTTVNPPFITSLMPQGTDIEPTQDIEIIFNQEMNEQSVQDLIDIFPETETDFLWDASSSALRIRPQLLEKNTEYNVSLQRGMETKTGGVLEIPVQFSFTTAGPLKLLTTTSENKNSTISVKDPIEIFFNQKIDQTVLASLVISPAISGTQTITENKITITPDTALSFDTLYTITIKAGAKSVYGLPSDKDQSIIFTSAPNETVLAVPFYKQQEAFTCNIAAARMLLAYKGISVGEREIIDHIGLGGKRGTGNPNVGYIDDYGTYWDALMKGVLAYRPARLIRSGKLSDIITEIQKNNPVMIWGQNGWSDPHDISWTTPDGTFIKAINGMHSSVVRGFRGHAENPTHIVLNDPWRGQYTIETKEFMRRWGFLSVALVVD